MKSTLAVLVLAISSMAFAQLQQPAPSATKGDKERQTTARSDATESAHGKGAPTPASPTPQKVSVPPDQFGPQDDKDQRSKQSRDWWPIWFGVLTLLVLALQAAISLRQARIMRIQSVSMRRQTRIMKENFSNQIKMSKAVAVRDAFQPVLSILRRGWAGTVPANTPDAIRSLEPAIYLALEGWFPYLSRDNAAACEKAVERYRTYTRVDSRNIPADFAVELRARVEAVLSFLDR